ncbi:MAG: 16S rRNA (guanine(527)-N(7))-methyltransferase RsmG [Bryobacterales bacterium]|nr:16S rRNA (guanine(527)-N(7))-methyltransferase RsmG [Bryobacterales bacterium]
MSFSEALNELLPAALPHRQRCVEGAARHLSLIEEANRQFNLTRITGPREAAIKHVLDSLIPWKLFAGASHIVDAGTGAGFPGIPLALVLPETKFTLLESTQKKARFVESVVVDLALSNTKVAPLRAEDWLKTNRADVVTARAVAPIAKAIVLFAAALKQGGRILLYKGPDADTEIAEATPEARKRQIRMRVVERYELPENMGARTLVELSRLH